MVPLIPPPRDHPTTVEYEFSRTEVILGLTPLGGSLSTSSNMYFGKKSVNKKWKFSPPAAQFIGKNLKYHPLQRT